MDYQTIRKLDTKNKLGKRLIRALISEKKQQQWSVRLKDKSRARLINEYCDQREAGLKALFRTCLHHLSPVTEPWLLLSQLPHSGSLPLNRLFDGHPEIYAYPDELLSAFAARMPWSEINPDDDPQRWIDLIANCVNSPHIAQHFKQDPGQQQVLPFVFLPLLQKKIFARYLGMIDPPKPRDVLNAYMTACFGAWVNYQNQGLAKKFVTVAIPPGESLTTKIGAFFDIYPEGRLISVIADPLNWYRRALHAEPEKYVDVKRAAAMWHEHLHSSLRIKDSFTDRTCLVRGEDLLARPEPAMRYLADFFGLTYDPILLTPTFNGDPTSAITKIKTDAVDNSKPGDHLNLDQCTLKFIEELTNRGDLDSLQEIIKFQGD